METQVENQRPHNGQLIYVPRKDTIRLLEIYVKRSLSLNDGTPGRKQGRKEKWVTMPRKHRRHSSDPALHLAGVSDDDQFSPCTAVDPPPNEPEPVREEPVKRGKKSKKSKSSFWKSLFGIFSQKSDDEKDEEEGAPSEVPEVTQVAEVSDPAPTCLPTTPVVRQKRKSMKRKSIRRRFSKRRLSLTKSGKELHPADITVIKAPVSVEPTYLYYEKVSKELEKIVQEVQEKEEVPQLSDAELISRLIAVTKEHGDAIDDKLKDNPALNNFFQRMTYASFQKVADEYLEKEASPTHKPPTVRPTGPDLVKLAFTCDFTAKIARLSKQNVGHITGLGKCYLQDRFEYTQACSDHPVSDCDS